MPETAQDAITAGIHRHFLDTGDLPTDGALALAQVVIAEVASWLRVHASPTINGDPGILASEWAARLLTDGLRDPYDEPAQGTAELLKDVPAPAANALLRLGHRVSVAEAERDELRADAKAWKYANRTECLACGVLAVTINPPHPDAPTASCGSCGMAYQLAGLDGAATDA